MVHDALHAFARLDADEAFEVARRDRKIDEEYESIQRQNITFMMEDPRSISACIDTIWAAKAIERIADHAKNVSEHVIFIAQGWDARHQPLEEVERAVAKT
jgi:phosphate transport system protein